MMIGIELVAGFSAAITGAEFATKTSGFWLISSATCLLINSRLLPANRYSIWTLPPSIHPKSRIPRRNALMRDFVSRSFSSSPTSTLTRRIRFGCCGHAAPGQTAAEPAITLMKSRRLICRLRGLGQGIVAVERKLVKGPNVRSEADICTAIGHVRFTPESDIGCVLWYV